MHPVLFKAGKTANTYLIRDQVKRLNSLLTVLTKVFKYYQKLDPTSFVTVATNRAVYSGRVTLQNFKNF